jgi:electron transfer flavoprotein beta subunit
MNILCLIKYVPDMDDFKYDSERNVLIREKMNQILNPEDALAVAFALSVKKYYPSTVIEVITMGPSNVSNKLEELLRLDVDQATLITDAAFIGSDTYATSLVLATCLKQKKADLILTGTHTMDGDTSHVPAQVAQWLGLPHLSNVINIKLNTMDSGRLELSADHDQEIMTFALTLPAIVSLQKEAPYKLPYVRYDDLNKDVSQRLHRLSCTDLGLSAQQVGFVGSKTKVIKSFAKPMVITDKIEVTTDEAGIQTVYDFLKAKGVLS